MINDITIRIVLVLMLMAGWVGQILDVKDAFLHGDFEDEEQVYIEVPQGFDKYYNPENTVLLLAVFSKPLNQFLCNAEERVSLWSSCCGWSVLFVCSHHHFEIVLFRMPSFVIFDFVGFINFIAKYFN